MYVCMSPNQNHTIFPASDDDDDNQEEREKKRRRKIQHGMEDRMEEDDTGHIQRGGRKEGMIISYALVIIMPRYVRMRNVCVCVCVVCVVCVCVCCVCVVCVLCVVLCVLCVCGVRSVRSVRSCKIMLRSRVIA